MARFKLESDPITDNKVTLDLSKLHPSPKLRIFVFQMKAQKEGWDGGIIDAVVRQCSKDISLLANYCTTEVG
jgi:hypothetical protein